PCPKSSRTAPVLNSCKQIAAYLGRGVRTVQRWEQNFGGTGASSSRYRERSAVLAIPEELTEWMKRSSVRSMNNGNGAAGGDTCEDIQLLHPVVPVDFPTGSSPRESLIPTSD